MVKIRLTRMGSKKRPYYRLAGDLPPEGVGLSVIHDEVGLVEGAGVPEAEERPLQPAIVDYPAAAERAVGDENGDAIERIVDDLVEVEDLERISPRLSALALIA